ncbi:MAG: AAA family ATPase, partial [Lentisphaeria bacterium]|nr:AAA family ATPase [Lentisphaeria bacterium]
MNTLHKRIELLKSQLKLSILGQDELVDALLVALFADGHILLEGLPGTAKTRAVKTLAQLLELDFDRVQFTPDLLPSDVIGYERLDQGALSFKEGPIFTNIMLADEINRAPPKVQS